MYNKKISLERLFPYVIEKNLFHKLKIDMESVMYITIPEDASMITGIVLRHLVDKGYDPSQSVITDATAGVGGDTISFANKFRYVNSIEMNKERYNYLSNNVNVYRFRNVVLYCDDLMKIIPQIENHDVIFMDPPWGGRNYKRNDNLRLYINDIGIEDCCLMFIDKKDPLKKMKSIPKFIVLKLPLNYDIEYMKSKLELYGAVCVHKLNKMIIVVFELKVEHIDIEN
jgi:predicted RNA methylase